MGANSVVEGISISIHKVRDQDKREDSLDYKEKENNSCKRDLREESVIEQHINEE